MLNSQVATNHQQPAQAGDRVRPHASPGQDTHNGLGRARPDPLGNHVGNALVGGPEKTGFDLAEPLRLNGQHVGDGGFSEGGVVGRHQVARGEIAQTSLGTVVMEGFGVRQEGQGSLAVSGLDPGGNGSLRTARGEQDTIVGGGRVEQGADQTVVKHVIGPHDKQGAALHLKRGQRTDADPVGPDAGRSQHPPQTLRARDAPDFELGLIRVGEYPDGGSSPARRLAHSLGRAPRRSYHSRRMWYRQTGETWMA